MTHQLQAKASYSPLERLVAAAKQGEIQTLAEDISLLCEEADRFCQAMKEELISMALQGKTGWNRFDDPNWTSGEIYSRVARRVDHRDPVSAANYLLFAWVQQYYRTTLEALNVLGPAPGEN
jgi:hypothetical protein